MTSTVTTSTVATLVSVTDYTFFASLGLILVVTLLLLLLQKEIFTGSTHPFAKTMTRVLNAAIVPLLIAFVSSAVVNLFRLIG